MDILIKSILNYIQNQAGHTNSVLAGGAVRDSVLGLTPRDYDLFVPSTRPKDITDLVQSIGYEFNVADIVCKTKFYDKVDNPQSITCVYGFTFEGKKIDVIGIKEEDDGDFADIVIKDFDYGINMAYHDGNTIYQDNMYFREDSQYGQATLVNLPGMYDLPNAMERFNTLNQRYKEAHNGVGLHFRAPCLMLSKDREKKKLSGYKSKYTLDELVESPAPQAWETINTPSTIPWATATTGNGAGGVLNTIQPVITGNTLNNNF